MSDPRSILTADFGSVYTRVLLIDAVDGAYRLVARSIVRSTSNYPAGDIALGLRLAAQQIEQITGRTLMDPIGEVITPEGNNRRGVDYFLATASSGRALRAILVGLMPDVSLESARHAVEGNYIRVIDTISLRDDRDDEDKLNAIVLGDPDLIFITGGTDGGALDTLWEVLLPVKLALASMSEKDRPIVIYAGNNRAISRVQTEFEALTRVFIADNVRPSLEEEYLRGAQLRIAQAFDAYKGAVGGGFDTVGAMSSVGVLPTAQGYRTVTNFLGTADEKVDTLVVVDVGSASSVVATYDANDRTPTKSGIRTDVGVGHAARALVEAVSIKRFRRWIPFAVAQADLLNYALNKGLRPSSIPQTRQDLYIEHALMRVGVEEMLENQRPDWRKNPPNIDRIIGLGSTITAAGTPGISAMLLVDAVQPYGVTELYTDPYGLIAAMGAAGYVVPEAVVQLADPRNLDYLCTVFSLDGSPRYGEKAGKYRIDYGDNDYDEGVITGGAIYMIPLQEGREATIHISGLRRGVRVGGRGGVRQKVQGGAAGVIIDARGRPIPLESVLADRSRFITAWYEFVSGVEHPTPSEAQLQPVVERTAPDSFMLGQPDDEFEEKPTRRGLFGRRRQPETPEDALDELLDDGDALALDELDIDGKEMDLDDLRL